MGHHYRLNNKIVYQQDDGEITAWFDQYEEKMTLSHEGTPKYQKLFYFLVAVGLVYLFIVFIFF
jgi:hypothetical protein